MMGSYCTLFDYSPLFERLRPLPNSRGTPMHHEMLRKSTPVHLDIFIKVQQCTQCQEYRPVTPKVPLVQTILPDRPWQVLGVICLILIVSNIWL